MKSPAYTYVLFCTLVPTNLYKPENKYIKMLKRKILKKYS